MQGLTIMACAGTPLMWKSSPETAISYFTNGIFHCRDIFLIHPLIPGSNPLPRQKSSDHLEVFSVFSAKWRWTRLISPQGKKKCIGNAAEVEGQTPLNYLCNLSCFLCWNVLHKGSFSTSERLNLKIVSMKSQACVRQAPCCLCFPGALRCSHPSFSV